LTEQDTKGFEPAKHHQLIINEIESFLASDDDVLLLLRRLDPLRALMSRFSCVLVSRQPPTYSILGATHSVEFAEGWGRLVRNDIAADENVLAI
jgi:hypothetical protein